MRNHQDQKSGLPGRTFGIAILASAFVSLAQPSMAQMEKVPAVDPEAVTALVEMSERLRDLESFTISAAIASEVVLSTGERLTSVEHVVAEAHAGTNLRLATTSPTRERVLYFNGETVTLWAPVKNLYTSNPFSGTNRDLIVHLANKFGYEIPLSDLFLFGVDPGDVDAIKQARFIQPADIDGRFCLQFAYRTEDADLQMWIDTAEGGFPCAYQIVDRTDPAHPTFFATVDVEPIVNLDDNRFTFMPPENAISIKFKAIEDGE